tara:strand:+ start:823 stop:1092 length:270 start_codon:yes stop_codon:yes gene_type:complete
VKPPLVWVRLRHREAVESDRLSQLDLSRRPNDDKLIDSKIVTGVRRRVFGEVLDYLEKYEGLWQCGCVDEPWVPDEDACPACGYDPNDY